MNKNRYIYLLIFMLSFSLFGCSNKKTVLEQSKKDMAIFKSGNYQEINNLIWGEDDLSKSSSTSSLEISDRKNDSIMNTIVKNNHVEVVSEKNNKVKLKVTAPNLNHFFDDIISVSSKIEDDKKLSEYMIDYIENADLIVQEVEIDAFEENGIIRINYLDPVFINAFTGGLVDGYTAIRNSLVGQ